MQMTRRSLLLAVAGAMLGASGLVARVIAAPQEPVIKPEERVIKVVAKKFDYTPNIIRLKKGESVVLELTTLDVVMGFNAPDFGVRADIIPGKVAQVRLQPQKTGECTFFCDIFCGSGHEEMNGTIIVEP
jgi:cytochrome c oxidase subunit II